MQTLLITGGCGFIGSNFVHYILEQSDFTGRVINLDKLTYAGNVSNLSGIKEKYGERYHFVHGDICDQDLVLSIFKEYQVDSICHFAAESHVDRSIADPFEFIKTNVVGTFTLLEAARTSELPFELFHHVSTDEVFGSLGSEGYFTETTPYHPNNPYSATKAGSDHLVRSYANTYKLPITLSNCSNNYGPYQFPEKLIPLCLLNALEGKAIPIYGDGKNTRDWLFVRDHCAAIWTIMKQGNKGETYNIGGHNEISNIDIVTTICNALQDFKPSSENYLDLITFVNDRPGHDWRYAIKAEKIERELGWKPSYTFETGLKETIEWYLNHLDWIKTIQNGEYLLWIKKHYQEKEQVIKTPALRRKSPSY
jgi:dTDP-glucose 4,6-dehydratase